MGPPEDIQDMLAFQRGDPEGFRRLFERYRGPIAHYLYRYTWNAAVAEELTQEVFLRVCRAAPRYEPRASFRTWLYRIATNVVKNEMRRREHAVRQEPLEGGAARIGLARNSRARDTSGENPEGRANALRLETEVQKTLARLPERQRLALLLCRHHGFSYRQIGEIMELRVGAVKSLVHRGTEAMRKGLAPYLEPEPEGGDPHAV